MSRRPLQGFMRIFVHLATGLVVLTGIASSLLLLQGYRVYASPEHINQWLGAGDLLLVQRQATPSVNATVVVQGLEAGSSWGIGRIQSLDPADGRVGVMDGNGTTRQLDGNRLLGSVEASMSGLGKWWQWLNRPVNLVTAVILPTTGLVLLESHQLAKLWVRSRRFSINP